jgi:hypothetical protein
MTYCHICGRETRGGPLWCDECNLPRRGSVRATALVAALVAATSASAAHCPHGQWYRVSLGRCFPNGSAIALAYEPHRRLPVHLVDEDPPPPPRPPEAPPSPPDALPEVAWPVDDADEAGRAEGLKALKRQLEQPRQ